MSTHRVRFTGLRKLPLTLALATILGIAGCASDSSAPVTRSEGSSGGDAVAEAARRDEAERETAAELAAEAKAERDAEAMARANREKERQMAREKAMEREAELEAEREAARLAEERSRREAQQRQAEAEAAAAAAANAQAESRAQAEREAMAQQEEAEAARMAQERQLAEERERAAAEAEQARIAAAAEAQAEREAAQAEAAAQRAAAASTPAPASTGSRQGNFDGDRPSQSEIAQLGNSLTPVGGVTAGNAAGTIPAWTGGITRAPAGYSPGDHHPDPYAADEILFTITAQNASQYADQLSPGQMAMFERYPEWKMNIYPTRRSASFPQRIYDKTVENARTASLTPDGEGVVNAAEGFPFPIPKNGPQLMWNHKLKFKGVAALRYNNQVAPTASGAYTLVRLREETLGLYYKEGNTIADIDNILLYFLQIVEAPARLAGNVLLVHETLNQSDQLRQAWIYNPGQRRVRRAPNVAYDNPGTASDGLRTNDMSDMFNGALDRFNWELVGRKEMFVPYNSYKAHSDDVTVDELVQAGHMNTDLMRYELHRIWVVDARLKEGVRHINPRRTFYLDEDSYQIVLIDHYDNRGDMWRFSEGHSINYYEVPTFWSTLEVHHDLQSGRYIAQGLDNEDEVYEFSFSTEPANFTPQALRKLGRR